MISDIQYTGRMHVLGAFYTYVSRISSSSPRPSADIVTASHSDAALRSMHYQNLECLSDILAEV